VWRPSPEYEKAFAATDPEQARALVVLEEPVNQANRKTIAVNISANIAQCLALILYLGAISIILAQ
jgi:hypothetical protein